MFWISLFFCNKWMNAFNKYVTVIAEIYILLIIIEIIISLYENKRPPPQLIKYLSKFRIHSQLSIYMKSRHGLCYLYQFLFIKWPRECQPDIPDMPVLAGNSDLLQNTLDSRRHLSHPFLAASMFLFINPHFHIVKHTFGCMLRVQLLLWNSYAPSNSYILRKTRYILCDNPRTVRRLSHKTYKTYFHHAVLMIVNYLPTAIRRGKNLLLHSDKRKGFSKTNTYYRWLQWMYII